MNQSFVDIGISGEQYSAIKHFLYEETGIDLGDKRQDLVTGRLCKRLRYFNMYSYEDYFAMVLETANCLERQHMLDLLTTNETYFFREIAHFEFLRKNVLSHYHGSEFRIWSAASSTGEEAYSLAMDLTERFGEDGWEVMGSDVSSRVLDFAKAGLYRMSRTQEIPQRYLEKYCFKGVGPHDGKVLVNPNLSKKIKFVKINLIRPIPDIGEFEVVFLRNVLIYFDAETQLKVIMNLVRVIKSGGYLMIGHAESLNEMGLEKVLKYVAPTIYQKV